MTVTFVHVYNDEYPCALYCKSNNDMAHISFKFQHKVIDGTPCHPETTNICIDGRCENLGCDLKINSKLQKDICGICGGNGGSCKLIKGEFTQPLGKGKVANNNLPRLFNFYVFYCDIVQILILGYVSAVDIPQGAKYVLVKEVKPCASFLGMFKYYALIFHTDLTCFAIFDFVERTQDRKIKYRLKAKQRHLRYNSEIATKPVGSTHVM